MKEKVKKLQLLFNNLRLRLRQRFFPGEVFYVNGSENLPPPLTKERENEIFRELEEGVETNRELLVIHNLRLVVYIARRFENTGVGIEDLVSIGTIGLIKAVNTFCPGKKIKLATYASRCIENEILMYLRKTSNRKNELSIDEPLNVDWDGNELLLGDVLGSDNDIVNRNLESRDEKNQLLRLVKGLDERERQIMTMRFGLFGSKEYTQKQVADMLGISQSYISRLEKRIIEKLKVQMEKLS
ncbi:MAG: RNA polymerase sporulation sigma factor SigE [Clostridia bacterium]|nr:RNA polymerase sporulation sigma factor SigE [Oscillospiraceae bacterium]MBQ7005313.1 RNA polymerase sporulation sigma factor SigE [Clostridia bacterium]